ncbi:putative membrane protein [Lachnellula willkommii]|uniref:Putative membrane protein n=1 Tax=Lachnellula willkommii TaxID=215461 RepID=A0A559MAM3_9HELO|nr:putative membrane protein [Lachnellula willkommii]
MSGTQHSGPRKRTPEFPTRQMTILAFMSIFPYIYYMIQDFQVTNRESEIPIYAGMVTSAFAFAEFSSGLAWGRLSDKIGRKPVLLTGLAGTALSMLVFGFAPSLPVALLARALGGLLNGNIGVLQTTVAEMVTVKEHQPFRSILGPMLGGALARPVLSYPSVFTPGSIWERFPYLLPNLVCTVIVSCGVVVGILFLEESHEEKKFRRDPGLEAGKWILSKFTRCAESKISRCEKASNLDEVVSLLSEDEQPPGYRTSEGSPNLPSTPLPEPREPLDLNSSHVLRKSKPATKAFTRQVVLNIVGYGILAYHTITFDSMLPTFLSTPPPLAQDATPWQLPFKFVDGYGLSTRQIGVVLSVQGIYSMIATVFLFPFIVRRLGALGLFRCIAISYPILYVATPYLVLLPDSLRMVGVYVVVIWKCTFATMSYPSNAILLTNSAPSLLMLGTINGVAASMASLCRAFGPTAAGFLFSAGLRIGYSGLAWWCSAIIAIAGALLSLSMSDKGGRMDVEDEKNDEEQELGFEDHVLDHKSLNSALAVAEARSLNMNDDEAV